MNIKRLHHPPQLRCNEHEVKALRWILSMNHADAERLTADVCALEMRIDHAWDGASWYRYRFFIWRDGDQREIISDREWSRRFEDVVQMEGRWEAEKWDAEQKRRLEVVQDLENHPVMLLQKHWEGILALGLIDLSIA